MKIKQAKIYLITLALFSLIGSFFAFTFPENQVLASETALFSEPRVEPLSLEFSMPGRIEGKGTYLEIKNSEYLNISLKSAEEIKVILESIPRMISIDVSSSTNSTSTNLTVTGLEPNKTYYQYQDSYKNEVVFVSDENGGYNWNQDLTKPHHIWIQEIKGTTFIGQDTTLGYDITGSVEITANNITLDCDGHSITSEAEKVGYGIYVNYKSGITIKNCNVSNFYSGMSLRNFNNSILSENTVSGNGFLGIDLPYSYSITLARNTAIENGYGIRLTYSPRNTLSENTVTGNKRYGIEIVRSGRNILRGNITADNQYNFWLLGVTDDEYEQDIDTSNTVDGKPIYYVKNAVNQVYDSSTNAGTFYCINCANVTIKDLTLTKNGAGVCFYKTKNSRIENIRAAKNFENIYLTSSTDNTVTGNAITGITLPETNYGILLDYSSNNNILADNTITETIISLWNSSGNTLRGNVITSPLYSSGIILVGSNGNALRENTVMGCNYGIFLNTSFNNKIYNNNFVDNGAQAYVYGGSSNFFDNGYPSGGNYWSDYTGVDEKKGTDQDEPGSDGIGDTTYTFPGGQDKYPFMKENGWEAPPEPEKWSFAIITDLHIGRGYKDYYGTSYEDNGEGEDYYLTESLEKVVNWINENKNKVDCDGIKCPIKFLTILGDTTNTAEKSQFLKVKEILDKLNDPNGNGDTADGIPYVPIFGNHDVWPYTDNEEASSALGESYFDEIFWDSSNSNFQLIQKFFGDSWKRDEVHKNYKNFSLNYKEMNFIGLDFTSRNPWRFGPGADPAADLSWETKTWLELQLDEYKERFTILFSHHPFVADLAKAFSSGPSPLPNELEELRAIIEGKNVLANFGGHIHGIPLYGFEKLPGFEELLFFNANKEYPSVDAASVITTESLMVGSNEEDEYLKEHDKGIIKIVKILGENEIDYKTNEGKYKPETREGKEFIALNPYIDFTFTQLTELLPCVFFKAHTFTKRGVSYRWDLGDGTAGSGEWETRCYSKTGTYNVILTVTDTKTGEKEYITQKVEVKEGIIPKFLKVTEEMADKIELISTKLEKDLTKIGQVFKDNVLIKVKHSPAEPVGLITVHFEKATEDIDLTKMIADTDVEKKKSILYMPQWPNEVEKEKILFIPK